VISLESEGYELLKMAEYEEWNDALRNLCRRLDFPIRPRDIFAEGCILVRRDALVTASTPNGQIVDTLEDVLYVIWCARLKLFRHETAGVADEVAAER
jgi:hypothetical protein